MCHCVIIDYSSFFMLHPKKKNVIHLDIRKKKENTIEPQRSFPIIYILHNIMMVKSDTKPTKTLSE